MDMLISIVATVMILAAAGLTLLVALSTGFFAGRVPSGPDSMAIMGPVIAGAISWVLTLAATWLCASRDGFAWVAKGPLSGLPAWGVAALVTVVVLGMTATAVWSFWRWADHGGGAIGLWGAFVAPMLLLAILLACTWVGPATLVSFGGVLAGLSVPCLAAGLTGFVAAASAANRWAASRAVEVEAAVAEHQRQEAEWTRRSGLTESERIAEDIKALSEATPFWSIGGMLLEVKTPEAGLLIVERARKVPEFPTELRSTIECPYPSLRGAAVEFIRRDPRREDAWAGLVSRAIDLLTDDIRRKGVVIDADRQEDIAREVERLIEAVKLYPAADFARAIAGLRAAVESAPPSEGRDRAMSVLTASGVL